MKLQKKCDWKPETWKCLSALSRDLVNPAHLEDLLCPGPERLLLSAQLISLTHAEDALPPELLKQGVHSVGKGAEMWVGPGAKAKHWEPAHTHKHLWWERDRWVGGRVRECVKKKSQRNPNIDKSPLLGPWRKSCIHLSWITVDVFTDALVIRRLDKHFKTNIKNRSAIHGLLRPTAHISFKLQQQFQVLFSLLDGSAKLSSKICHPEKSVEVCNKLFFSKD